MILVKSGGNPGHGESSIFGIIPPRSGLTCIFCSFPTMIESPSVVQVIPKRPKARRIALISLCSTPVIVMLPRVAAANPINEPISI